MMSHKKLIYKGVFALFVFFFCQRMVFAGVQVSQDFESGWTGVPWAGYSNAVTNATGWIVNQAKIYSNTADSSYSGELWGNAAATNAWIQSPSLTSGAGIVIYSARMGGNNSFDSNSVAIEVRYLGDSNWTPITTNQIGQPNTYKSFTNSLNSSSNQTVRLRKITPGGLTTRVLFDNISITYPAASITNIAVTLTPPTPMEYADMSVTATVSVVSIPDSLAATNFWRLWPAANWTAIAMPSNQPNVFATVTNIPGLSSGSIIDYFVQTAHSYTQTLFFTTSAVYTVSIRPRSSYTNMLITTTPTGSMQLGNNYQWQGVVNVTNNNPVFKFQATANGNTTQWGDLDQSVTNLPLSGIAETNGGNITLYTTNNGYYVFTFNETNLAYDVRPCVYEDLTTWSNPTYQAPGVYTNNGGWILSGGAISNDTTRSLVAILNGTQSGITNFIQSPQLTNGIGQISFWYRNDSTNPTTSLSIQVAPSTNSTSWTTLSNITSLSSATYIFAMIPASDLDNQCIRILNQAAGTNSRVWLDDIVIASPGSGVQASNLTNSPANPGSFDPVTISIDLTPRNGAVITNVVTWYRNSTNLPFEAISMTLSNGHYSTIPPIPQTAGTVQYAVQYYFTGYQAGSPAFYPLSGTNSPYSYTATNTLINTRVQDFEPAQQWVGVPWANYSNSVTNVTGWVVNQARIYTNASDSSACGELQDNAIATNAWIQSPTLINGAGSIVYSARMGGSTAGATNSVAIEVQYQGNATWIPITTNQIGQPNTYKSFTNFLCSVNIQTVRLRKIIPGNGTGTGPSAPQRVLFDNISITYAPADVTITNVFPNPGYPQAGQPTTVSCDVLSINPAFSALNITPTLFWYPSGGSTNSIPMPHVTGSTYTTITPNALTNVTRDVVVTYWVKCDFAGYAGIPADNRSPRLSTINSYLARAFSSSYSNIGISVNGSVATGRLLTNSVWQAVFTSPATNSLSFAFQGNGFSSGAGYSPNTVLWGNSNAYWQSALPLADGAGTGQTAFAVSGSFSGQYVMRFNESTRQYVILRCVFQDFDTQGGGNGSPYEQRSVSVNTSGQTVNFNDWTANISQTRLENFSNSNWLDVTNYTDIGAGGTVSYVSFGMISTNLAGTTVMQSRSVVTQPDDSFIGQASHQAPYPSLVGINTITAKVRTMTSNLTSLAVYLMPTNGVNNPIDLSIYGNWIKPPLTSWSGISNAVPWTNLVYTLKTNATFDVIFSATQNMYIAELSVSDWYAANNSKNGWTAYQSWIQSNACIFQASRSAAGVEQYLLSPALSGGVSTISFDYSGTATNPTSVSLDVSYVGSPYSWTNLLTISNAVFNGTGTDLSNRQYALLSSASPIYVRIKNMTPAPGGLLIDNVQISGFATSNDWYMNSAAIKYQAQTNPPAARQYYMGAGYLNSNRTSEVSAVPELVPSTNVFPCIRTPALNNGIGEISFWYRNWAISGTPAPARLFIQKSVTGNSTPADWSYVDAITNIVNTNDYLYYQTSLYDTSSRYIRICNDDTNAPGVGRVCLDDILVTEPLASRLSLSNLVINPGIPLYTNPVNVAVDVYNLFYGPSSLSLTSYYGTASTYTGLASAVFTGLPMACISSNLTTPGQSYRYQTTQPIPTNAIDTFVKYYVTASFGGYHTEVSSPQTNKQFSAYPSWLNPLNSVNGTNSAYYIVFGCPTGSVWINEFNVIDDLYTLDHQYVEFCGKYGTDISNWRLQILDENANTQTVYAITNSTTFNDTTNGFGFWVIGKTGISPKNQTLTSDLPTSGQGGGIRLSRPSGVTVDAVSYTIDGSPSSIVSALTSQGFRFTASDDSFYNTAILLTGSNTNGFSWSWTTQTYPSPGQINVGQILVGVTQNSVPPIVSIYSIRLNTNVWIECSGTNNWVPTPWYSTNLMNTNGWVFVTPFVSTYPSLSSSNTYTLNFPKDQLTNSPAYFFKVVTTNTP